jgi:hypothetical protein
MVEQSNIEKPPDQSPHGLTRREALKKGALLGGALIWTTPAVQAIGILPAQAQEVSPFCVVELSAGPVQFCARTTPDVCACVAACDPEDLAGFIACFFACLENAELEPC